MIPLSDVDIEALAERRDTPLRCRLGWHKWSENRGGVKVCIRDGCRKATTYGITGVIHKLLWEEELYRKHPATDVEQRSDTK